MGGSTVALLLIGVPPYDYNDSLDFAVNLDISRTVVFLTYRRVTVYDEHAEKLSADRKLLCRVSMYSSEHKVDNVVYNWMYVDNTTATPLYYVTSIGTRVVTFDHDNR